MSTTSGQGRPARGRRALAQALVVALLVPFLVLWPAGSAAAADATECYLVASGTSFVVSFDKTTGVPSNVANTANGVTGLAFGPDGTLYATRASTLGTIDLATGAFTPRSSGYGVAGDSTAFDDVVAIAFDPSTGILYGIQRRSGADELLIAVDPDTGSAIPGALGGADYLTLRRPTDTDASAIEDLTVRPSDGRIFLVDSDASGSVLATIDPATWTVSDAAPITYSSSPLAGVHGVSFDGTGQLYLATTHPSSSQPRSFFAADPTTAVAMLRGTASSGSGHRGMACGSEPANTVTGSVFEDPDASGVLDGAETGGPAGVEVGLYDGTTLLQQATTDAGGTYSFALRATGSYEVRVDAASLPPGTGASPPTARTVTFAGTGEAITGADLPYRFASVAGTVWNDVDGDGDLDAGEPGIGAADVIILDDGDAPVTSVTTAGDGTYDVYGLTAGTYTVEVDTDTLPTGIGDRTTSDPFTISLAAGEALADADIGYDGGAVISGTVWNDLDGDGEHDASEPPLSGAVVAVDESTTVTTAGDGTYTFVVAPGTHTVTLANAPGSVTGPSEHTVTVAEGGTDAGNDFLSDASGDLAGSAFSDRDQDGDPTGDPPLEDVAVALSRGGVTAATATTGSDGTFTIPDLEAGTYDLDVTAPDGAGATTTIPATVSITTGSTLTLDPFGFAFAAIGGLVWNDLDGEGDHDETDVLVGLTVELTDGTTTWTTSTDADGTYRFDELPGGTYTVSVDGDGRGDPTVGSLVVAVADGAISLDNDLAVDASITIPVVVFNDLDGDGERDPGEDGIPDVDVQLTDGTTAWTSTTDTDGSVTFDGLVAGTYTRDVDEDTLPAIAGLTTANDPHAYTLADGEAASDETLIGYDGSVSITGLVWNDLNDDEEDTSDEPRYAGVEVVLQHPDGSEVDRTTTDAVGTYSFSELPPGDYQLDVVRGDTIPADAPLTTADSGPIPVSLGFAEAAAVDFGYDASADLTGRVWNDLDADEQEDGGEPGLAGVELHLVGEHGTLIATSDANGDYEFRDVAPGTYDLDVVDGTVPAGAALTTPSEEPIPLTLVALAAPRIAIGYDASAEIHGRLWNDLDANGSDDAEPALADVRLVLENGAGVYVTETVTATGGTYSFVDLAPGDYAVVVDEATVPTGALRTVPTTNRAAVSLAAAEAVTDVDFGYDASSSVGDLVWDDLDGNGQVDAGEPGLPGVTVRLLDADGAPTSRTATTDPDGGYRFDDLAPGVVHQVEVDPTTLPSPEYVATTDHPRATDVAIEPVAFDDALDLGFWRPATLTGQVFLDENGDGDAAGDDPLPGIEVRLTGPTERTTTTDASGNYRFGELPPGDHTVEVIAPDRHIFTAPDDDGIITVAIEPGDDTALADTGIQPWIARPDLAAATISGRGEVRDDIAYPFALTNAGNVPDSYELGATSSEGYTVTLHSAADHTTSISTVGPLDPGESVALVAVVTIADDAARGTLDTTTITATSGVGTDEEPPQDTAEAVLVLETTVVAPALTVTKWSGVDDTPGFVTPGEPVSYTVIVANDAGSDVATARGIELSDTPSHGEIDLSTVAINGVDVEPDPTFPLSLGDLPPDSSTTVTFEVLLPVPLADGTGVSNAVAADPTGNPVPTGGELGATGVSETDVVGSAPVPRLHLAASPPSGELLDPGALVTYTVTATNHPDSTDTWRDVAVSFDPPPDGVNLVSGSLVTEVGDLAPGVERAVTLTFRVDDPIADGTTLTAVGWADGDNGSATGNAITHTVDVVPGVTVGPDRAVQSPPGTVVVHGHLLTNSGNVTDAYELRATSDKGWPVTVHVDADADGVPDPDEEASATGLLAPGDAVPLLVRVAVPADEADGTVQAVTVVATSVTDPGTSDEAFDLVTVVDGKLTIAKSASPASSAVNPGQRVTYTLVISNPGGAPTSDVRVTDEVPVPANYLEGSTRVDGVPVADGPPGQRNPLAAANDGLALGILAPGMSRTVTFAVDVRSSVPDGTPLTNTATANGAGGLTASDTVTQLITASPVLDVAVTTTPPEPGPVTARDRITYRIAVSNVGNAPATTTTLFADIPAHTSYVTGSTAVDGVTVTETSPVAPTSTDAGGLVLGRLEADGNVKVVTFDVLVDDPVADGDRIELVARVTTDQGVRATTPAVLHTVDVTPDVTLGPDGSSDVPPPGQAAYPHVVVNTGDVTDAYELGAVSDRGWMVNLFADDDADGEWDAATETTVVNSTGDLAPGETFRIIAVVDVPPGTLSGVKDVTTVTATSQADPRVAATAIDVTRAIAPLLSFDKSAIPSANVIEPGGAITYVLVVENRGHAPAPGIRLTDRTPANATYRPGSTTRDGTAVPDATTPSGGAPDTNPLDPGNGGLDIGTLPARTQMIVQFTVDVAGDAMVGTTITNHANLELGALGTLSDTAQHTVSNGVVLHVDKHPGTAEMTPVTAGERLAYTVTVTNTGPVPATDVTLIDETPAHTSLAPGAVEMSSPGVPIGDLAPGESATRILEVVVEDPVEDGMVIENVATAAAASGAEASSRAIRHDVDVTPAVAIDGPVDATGPAGGVAWHPHVITNTGDVTDSYELAASSSAGWDATIYPDPDGDGAPEADASPVTVTPALPPGGDLRVVVRVDIPAGVGPGTVDRLWVTARSNTHPEIRAGVVDRTTVVRARLDLAKSATPSVLTPGDRSTYTLTLRNVGQADAHGVVLLDSAPGGTTYVPGSTRRDGTLVPDTAGGGLPLVAGLPIGILPAGGSTIVTFDVVAGADLERNFIVNVAEAIAEDTDPALAGTAQPFRTDFGLELRGSQHVTARPGATVVHPHVVINSGDVPDEIALSAVGSSGFPVELRLDADRDGRLDPGDPVLPGTLELDTGGSSAVLAVVTYPEGVPDGLVDEITVVATSLSDPDTTASAIDRVTIVAPTLGITKTATPDGSAPIGGTITYRIAVENSGSSEARNVELTDETPLGTTYLAGSTTVDGARVDDGGGSPLADGLALGVLAAGARRTVEFSVAVDPSVGLGAMITNIATVEAAGAPLVFSNLVANLAAEEAQLHLAKDVVPNGLVGPGQILTWTVLISNLGTATAEDVVVVDPLSPGHAYLPGSSTLDGIPVGDDAVLGTGLGVGAIAPGSTRTFTFRTQAQAVGAFVENVVEARHAGSDTTVLSNVAGVTVDAGIPLLPLTGAPWGRTLGTGGIAIVAGWILLYVAKPERSPLPVLLRRRSRT